MKTDEILLIGGIGVLLWYLFGQKGSTSAGVAESQPTGCFGTCGGVAPVAPATNVRTLDVDSAKGEAQAVARDVIRYVDVPVYAPSVYGTSRPVVPSEPGVSQGVPYPGISIPLAPGTVAAPRFPGDTQVLTQCPRGQLQGGSPSSMNYLLTSQDAAAKAWRARFCD